ncbi:hypothetical protein THAOC_28507 [Thalassiosira oceanica]|uniref:DUF7495 domain-containing protein n=1 Tax=Thalassiosira oceanica TaxID=159749 RepID=K0RTP1_THAOC|nr:hypothetical protein THAOC_28507 [Thalassiosira oceanica]|eukprot:EJK52246.1 hypothetical protein THAOC_28507 [Thalassiosira oceanica]
MRGRRRRLTSKQLFLLGQIIIIVAYVAAGRRLQTTIREPSERSINQIHKLSNATEDRNAVTKFFRGGAAIDLMSSENQYGVPESVSAVSVVPFDGPLLFDRAAGWNGITHEEGQVFCTDQGSRHICPWNTYCQINQNLSMNLGILPDNTTSWAPTSMGQPVWVSLGGACRVNGVLDESEIANIDYIMCCHDGEDDVTVRSDLIDTDDEWNCKEKCDITGSTASITQKFCVARCKTKHHAEEVANVNEFLRKLFHPIVDVLTDLAQTPSEQLRNLLEGSDGENDPFQLQALEQGECPFPQNASIDWLPERPIMSRTAAQWFQNPQPSSSSSSSVVVYYEHLSKAGGTSFCKLAQSNMAEKEVPSRYCMPSEPRMLDARVGSWTEQKLLDYVQNHPHRLVSNEWEPFNHAFLERFQPTQQQKYNNNDLILLFVTSIRHPINRLLSAYKFWGILHNWDETKPSFDLWLHSYANRSNKWKIRSTDINANVGNFNFATWKFSGGKLPISDRQLHAQIFLSESTEVDFEAQTEDIWKEPFQTAIRTLARFDLAIPMEYLSDHTAPLTNLLGWTNFEKSHVVPSGNVTNNEATKELSPLQYAKLWDANKLDIILYRWTCAVYLTRLNCT